jgi:KDO2-lipid IV(A) lauroyltransferase
MIRKAVCIIGGLPTPVRRATAFLLGLGLIVFPNQAARVTRQNIRMAFPERRAWSRYCLANASLIELVQKSFDIAATWVRSPEHLVGWVKASDGLTEFLQTPAATPKLILLPHLGNWELFGMWLSQYQPYTALFRPLRADALTTLVRNARGRGGNELVPTDSAGLRQLMTALRSGASVIVLPDQTPHAGQGVYVPFFGIQTLTPTLIARLIQKTKPHVFIAAAIRDGSGYQAIIERVEILDSVPNTVEICRRMNLVIETLVRRYPTQYQWEYRRFRNAPDGSLRYP